MNRKLNECLEGIIKESITENRKMKRKKRKLNEDSQGTEKESEC